MASPPPPPRRVCVIGAGGFIASWLVKLLLSQGSAVHATVRDPTTWVQGCSWHGKNSNKLEPPTSNPPQIERHPKNAFLQQLDGAPANLRLFKADVLDGDALAAAFAGCEGVFHPATPAPGDKLVDPEKELVTPTVTGTKNVLEACSATGVQKVVVVSSAVAACLNPSWPEDRLKDESCWSDKQLCKETEVGTEYCLARTQAEEMALEYGARNGLQVVTVLPGHVVGPLMQTVVLNTSTRFLQYIITGGPDTVNNKFWPIVHVHDVADALLLAYEKAESSERYICAMEQMDIKDMVDLMKSMYPNYNYVDKTVDVDHKVAVTSDKLRSLGWKPRSLKETLADSVEFLEKAGLLEEPCRLPYLYRMATEK
ncbi:hypothetical protein ACP70R_006149 [Stipagrostis hirtigluma subsp. patula]